MNKKIFSFLRLKRRLKQIGLILLYCRSDRYINKLYWTLNNHKYSVIKIKK